MNLKTIINTKLNSFIYCLMFSLVLHGVGWLFAPEYRSELRLNELYSDQQVVSPDRFIEIKRPDVEIKGTSSKSTVSAPKVAQSKAPKTKKVKRRRRPKRKSVKRLTQKKVVSKIPNKQVIGKSQSQTIPTSKPTHLASSVQSPQTGTPRLNDGSSSIKTEDAQFTNARRMSKRELRGLLRGYYKSLDSLMSSVKAYPRSAKRLKLEGRVLVELVVNRQGKIISVKLVRSSGHELLDQAALAQVQKIGRVPSIPSQIDRSSLTFQFGLDYILQS